VAMLLAARMPEARAALIRMRLEAGRGPRGANRIAIVRMECIDPAGPRMLVPGLAGVVFPGALQFGEGAVVPCLPWHVGEQLGQRAQPLFAPPRFLVLRLALDEIRREARQDVEQPQVALRRRVWTLPVCRAHHDQLARWR